MSLSQRFCVNVARVSRLPQVRAARAIPLAVFMLALPACAGTTATSVSVCDYFAQNCPSLHGDGGGAAQGCFANNYGEGICGLGGSTATEGDSCQLIDECAPTFGCHAEGADGAGVGRPYCGGAANKPCTNGRKCIDYSTTLPISTIGFCAG